MINPSLIIAISLALLPSVRAHEGDLDKMGGHFVQDFSSYHFHRKIVPVDSRDLRLAARDAIRKNDRYLAGSMYMLLGDYKGAVRNFKLAKRDAIRKKDRTQALKIQHVINAVEKQYLNE